MINESPGDGVRKFYDETAVIWEALWGDHMHHGLYRPAGNKLGRRQAQQKLVETLLDLGEVKECGRVLDAGCGIGGSSRYLAETYDAEVLGVTISRTQCDVANELLEYYDAEGKVTIREQDLLTLPKNEGPFDLIWCVECLEHIDAKKELFDLFYEIMPSGGRLLLTTWCLSRDPAIISGHEVELLDQIYKAFHWAPLEPDGALCGMLEESGMDVVAKEDWTKEVRPYWNAIRKSALNPTNLLLLQHLTWDMIKRTYQLKYLESASKGDLIRYKALCCVKQ